ncbi:MAG: DUF4860 domain-containing protein [Atopobiaceae bacterium]|nr:DUF4860 domain-containing protein [Atopobiaceae bacterium]MCH4277221.1 DUF4860 domain-containing protein [Atopobiaceae bacterium]MDD2588306.1 DUF4860 domain-containing protein [Atopobiaceae bacterium]
MTTHSADLMEAIADRRDTDESEHGNLGMVLIFVFFVVFLLLAIFMAVAGYRSTSATTTQASNVRLTNNLVTNIVRTTDASDALAAGQGPEGRSLVLLEHLDTGTYETRIYLSGGKVVEEYALAGSAYTPAKATELVSSSTFSFTYSNGLLSITTDTGTSDVALRSLEGSDR